MVLSMAFGLAMAEIVLREEKMSEETTCILKSKRLSKRRCFTGFFEQKIERSDRERQVSTIARRREQGGDEALLIQICVERSRSRGFRVIGGDTKTKKAFGRDRLSEKI